MRNRIVGVNVPASERLVTGVLGAALVALGVRRRSRPGAALAGLGAIAVARALVGRCPVNRARAIRKGIQVRRAVTIQCTPREVYDLCREPTNLPKFMRHVASVTPEDDNISRWVVEENGHTLSWRSQIVEETPGHRLRWRSLPGGDIELEGSLELFELDHGRGTQVEVKLHYFPPGGLVVASALYMFLRRLAGMQLGVELARLRQLLETGEIATGSHRIEEVEEEDQHVLEGTRLARQRMPPVASAQHSGWPTVMGGER
ncbi:MAG: SRPBCC family protein [Kofleriaceae bacterium]|nr:SRPBCC family protein [Kofleriaceae bacterium]